LLERRSLADLPLAPDLRRILGLSCSAACRRASRYFAGGYAPHPLAHVDARAVAFEQAIEEEE